MKNYEIDHPYSLLTITEPNKKYFPTRLISIRLKELEGDDEYESHIMLDKGEVERLVEYLQGVLNEIKL